MKATTLSFNHFIKGLKFFLHLIDEIMVKFDGEKMW